ncbi:MAG: hypothetical protein JW751_30985 [Polyangiaceae bacterium]|nr:hypothetical protein [Polyangiaceae bacterium]
MLAHAQPVYRPVLLASDANSLCGSWRDILFVVFKHEVRLVAVKYLHELGLGFAAEHPNGIGLVTVVEERALAPTAEIRDALTAFLRSLEQVVRASAVVQEGGGFRAGAARGVVTGLTPLAGWPFPHQVFDAVPVAVRWLEATGPLRWVGYHREAVAALADLRRPH